MKQLGDELAEMLERGPLPLAEGGHRDTGGERVRERVRLPGQRLRQGLHAQLQFRLGQRRLDRARGQLVGQRQDDRVACRERLHRGHVLVDLRGRGRVQVPGLPALAGLDPQPQVIGLLPEHLPLRGVSIGIRSIALRLAVVVRSL
ncbi:hypothetical protein [Nonomuraea solani]|uniref:hypothetical protein n=1 Tax=Nonomuraea solani TaxID=1144553 RepID=UPI00190E7CF5|nr:hypothetical protein [Nonomuraea solani]